MNISQPGLTTSIARLERTLGARLFDRGRYGAVLTPHGALFRKRAQLVLAELRLANLELSGIDGAQHGSVHVGLGTIFAEKVFPSALLRFAKHHPRVEVHTLEGASTDLFERLARGELDFVASTPAMEGTAPADLVVEPVARLHAVLAVGSRHPLAQVEKPIAAALTAYPLIVSARVGLVRQQLIRMLAAEGVTEPLRFLHTDSLPLIRQMLLGSEHVAVLPPMLDILGLAPEAIRLVSHLPLNLTYEIAMVRRRDGSMSAAAEALFREVQRAAMRIVGPRDGNDGRGRRRAAS
jgi:DNA-binding transcriptional LysR family regulator